MDCNANADYAHAQASGDFGVWRPGGIARQIWLEAREQSRLAGSIEFGAETGGGALQHRVSPAAFVELLGREAGGGLIGGVIALGGEKAVEAEELEATTALASVAAQVRVRICVQLRVSGWNGVRVRG